MGSTEQKAPIKVAVGCQGGGMHAAFAVGVLTEILNKLNEFDELKGSGKPYDPTKTFELVALSGASAGALCTLATWYGLARTPSRSGSPDKAIETLDRVWNAFTAGTPSETILNGLAYYAFRLREAEAPVLGLSTSGVGINPASLVTKTVARWLPSFDVRKQYFDLHDYLTTEFPEFGEIDCRQVKTRLLVGATEVVHGVETVFDSAMNAKKTYPQEKNPWRKRMRLSLKSVEASGALPEFSETVFLDGGWYWDGLYSQNPPVRQLFSGVPFDETPDELWIVRINPQEWPERPTSRADVVDRQNELMGNLSLNKELDFILTVNGWVRPGGPLASEYKPVTVRTIKMTKPTADTLRYSSKFDRSRASSDKLRDEGMVVAREWLGRWPMDECWPEDAAYRSRLDL